ncbi:hypothetical protein [Thalassoglobus sp.]|uniref:hypothetical protein n=1 Tax=Thalassoglobus sp. TaxID=2795869 RepID=UPI003AA7C812
MNSMTPGNRSGEPKNWPLPRLIAFSSMMLTISSLLLFVITGLVVNYAGPDLGDQSMLMPFLGAVLFGGSIMALLGLVAGLVDLVKSRDQRGVSVVSVVVNGTAFLFVVSIVTIGFVRQF